MDDKGDLAYTFGGIWIANGGPPMQSTSICFWLSMAIYIYASLPSAFKSYRVGCLAMTKI